MLADAGAPAVLADVLAVVMLALPAPRLRCARSLPLPLPLSPARLLLHRIVVLLLLRRAAVSDRIATLAALAPLPRARIDPSPSECHVKIDCTPIKPFVIMLQNWNVMTSANVTRRTK